MIEEGKKVQVIINANSTLRNRKVKEVKYGYIYAITNNIITIMYRKNGHDTYKDSFIKHDLISRNIVIKIMNKNNTYEEVTRNELKQLGRRKL